MINIDLKAWPYPLVDGDISLSLACEGNPCSKARPRFDGSGKVYTPRKTREYEEFLKWNMKTQRIGIEPDSIGKFGLRCVFYRADRQRIDCDNLLKAVSDAATGVVWKDDAQVLEIFGKLVLGQENPRVDILIHRVEDLNPKDKCKRCGNEIKKSFNCSRRIFCSQECFNKSKRTTMNCRECSVEFEIPNSLAQKRAGFCTRKCSMKYHGKIKTSRSGPQTWKCLDCGGFKSKAKYERCQECSMKNRLLKQSNYWKLRHTKSA